MQRGLMRCRASKPKPSASMRPGANDSTTMSAVATRAANCALPAGASRSIVTPRLLALKANQ